MVARQVSLVTGEGRSKGKGSRRSKLHAISVDIITNKKVACSSAKKKLKPSTTRRRVTIVASKQSSRLNVDAAQSDNTRKVVMTVLKSGSSGSTNINSAVQLHVKPRVVVNTTKNLEVGRAVFHGDQKMLQKDVTNHKISGMAAARLRGAAGAVRGGGKVSNMTSSSKNTAIGKSSVNNRSSSNNSSSKSTTALATAKLIVSAGSHPKNSDIKQLLGAYEKGWVADKTFALELQRLLV